MMSLIRRGRRSGYHLYAICILLGLFFQPSSVLNGQQESIPLPTQKQGIPLSPGHLLLEWGWGWYSVADSRYSEVYSQGGGMVTFAIHPFLRSVGRHSFGFSAGIKSFTKEGESTVTGEDARLTLTPIYLGGEYMLRLEPFFPGVEIGVDHCLYSEKSPLMTTKGSTTGFHIQGHLAFQLPGLTFVRMKLYIRHSKLPAEETASVNLGGLEYGVGLLIKLNFIGSNK